MNNVNNDLWLNLVTSIVRARIITVDLGGSSTAATTVYHCWGLFIYLFIRHDSVQPGSYGPLEKQIKCLERGRTSNSEVVPSSPMNKCKNAKIECGNTAVPSAAKSKSGSLLHDLLPQYCCPLATTGASREGSFVNRPGCAGFLLARLGIGKASCR